MTRRGWRGREHIQIGYDFGFQRVNFLPDSKDILRFIVAAQAANHAAGDIVKAFGIQDVFGRLFSDVPFQKIFSLVFLPARAALFLLGAGVVMIDISELPAAGFTNQRGPAVTAEDFSAKPIGFFGFSGRRRAFISGNTRLTRSKVSGSISGS